MIVIGRGIRTYSVRVSKEGEIQNDSLEPEKKKKIVFVRTTMKLSHIKKCCQYAFCLFFLYTIEAFPSRPEASHKRGGTSRRSRTHYDDNEPVPLPCPVHDDNNRRRLLQQALTSATATSTILSPIVPANAASSAEIYLIPTPPFTKDVSWPLGKIAFSLLPLAGTSTRRATVEECIVPDTIWTHDQIQGIVNVNVPVRQTVIRLKNGGGLWVHNPVAPTPQLLEMMQRLVDNHGPVKHIVLGTVALEHKATLGAFASYFPTATVWLQPGQWAFPVNLPLSWYGLVQRGPRLREIPVPAPSQLAYTNMDPEWMSDLDYQVLGPLYFQSVGAYSETAFFHKDTSTLLVTDCVVSVTQDPPAIVQEDARALLFHARDWAGQDLTDTVETRRRGWRRMVQFGLVFFPSQIDVVPGAAQALAEAQQVPPNLRNLGQGAVPFNLYPWSWKPGNVDQINFDAISENGTLFCPPILTKLILDREPERTLEFVDQVCTRFASMKRIIPCHLNNNIQVKGSKEFSRAFDPLRSRPGRLVPQRALVEDLALLQKASDLLTTLGVVAPSVVCDGEPARTRGRFARQQQRRAT
jgi:hypothetical protein